MRDPLLSFVDLDADYGRSAGTKQACLDSTQVPAYRRARFR